MTDTITVEKELLSMVADNLDYMMNEIRSLRGWGPTGSYLASSIRLLIEECS